PLASLSIDRARPSSEGLAHEPGRSTGVEGLYLRSPEARHVGFDREADRGLQVGEVTVTLTEACQEPPIGREPGRRIDRVHAVLLVDGLAKHQTPTFVTLLDEVIETASADDVHEDIVHAGTLRDRHFGL